MSAEPVRSAVSPSRFTVGWVLIGVALYVPLLYGATLVGVAPVEAALELALPVIAMLWGSRDLLRVPQFGAPLLMAGLLLLIAGSFDVSGLLTGWPGGERRVADVLLVAGMLGSVWIESRRGDD